MPITIGPGMTDFIDVTEVRAHANIDDTHDDAELRLFAGAAQEAVEGLVGPVIHRTVVETVQSRGGVILLTHAPVVSVTSVTGVTAPYEYTLNAAAGLLVGTPYDTTVTVTYVAGRTVVPDSIRTAALIIAKHLWRTQLGAAPVILGEEPVASEFQGMSYGLPNRALDLLRPYLLAPTVA